MNVRHDVLSLSEICTQLNISIATGRNWVRLGKLVPSGMKGRSPFFSRSYAASFKEDITTGENQALRRRRNKKYVSGRGLYDSYVSGGCLGVKSVGSVLDIILSEAIEVDEELLGLVIANAAIQMVSGRIYENTISLMEYLNDPGILEAYTQLVSELIKDVEAAKEICGKYRQLFSIDFRWEDNEDVLGLLYISCLNIGDRKATGAYYTPTAVVKRLIEKLEIGKSGQTGRILDPCCGTGNFLLQLPDTVTVENIYGNDLDKVSVIIARINIALKYRLLDLRTVFSNITNTDFLLDYTGSGYDYVIGNPPWGYDYTAQEGVCLKSKYRAACGTKTESYDVFTEHALETVRANGIVSFVLPEAVLNVKSHYEIRRLIIETSSIRYLEYLGNVFDGVQCPCIIIQLVVTGKRLSTVEMEVAARGQSFRIRRERNVTPEYFSFTMNDEEYAILEKIEQVSSVQYLEGQAIFALGIVTGNNKEYISNVKTSDNEPVLKGSDLLKYRYVPTQNYIEFKPETFQQVAPTEYYRRPEKLLYRFICSQLVFAYDDAQTLSLNSCNILIPEIPGLSIKYVLAILNSRIAQYYFKKKFNSVKVLRSHLERIPIACPEKAVQEEIVSIVDLLLSSEKTETMIDLYNQIDKKISAVYGMSEMEYQRICSYVDQENIFLFK